jgi:outer membrane protein TolC
VGVQLSIPITPAASSVYEARQLASQAAQLEIEQAGLINTKSLGEIVAHENLVLAQANMASYLSAYRIAGKSLAEARRQYRLATIDYTQFLATEAAYFTAEVSYEQSKYNTINAAAQYCVAAGIPLAHLFQILGVKS